MYNSSINPLLYDPAFETITAGGGLYSIPDVPIGDYFFFAEHDFGYEPYEETITVTAGVFDYDFQMPSSPKCTVDGCIRDANTDELLSGTITVRNVGAEEACSVICQYSNGSTSRGELWFSDTTSPSVNRFYVGAIEVGGSATFAFCMPVSASDATTLTSRANGRWAFYTLHTTAFLDSGTPEAAFEVSDLASVWVESESD